jgi:hypothetical protein
MPVLIGPIMASNQRQVFTVARFLTLIATSALMLAFISSLVLLIRGIPVHKDEPATLLRRGKRALVH